MDRYLSLDPGEKTVGVAVGEAGGIAPTPLPPLARRPHARFLRAVASLAAREGAGRLVVGLPLVDGRTGPRAQAALALATELRRATGLPVETEDESFTTAEALEMMEACGVGRARALERADGVAAALILERHLRKPSPGGPGPGADGRRGGSG
jgi:putative Holliday junction resolvase